MVIEFVIAIDFSEVISTPKLKHMSLWSNTGQVNSTALFEQMCILGLSFVIKNDFAIHLCSLNQEKLQKQKYLISSKIGTEILHSN